MTPGPPEFPGTYPGTIKPIPDCALLTRTATLVCVGDIIAVRQLAARDYRIGDAIEQFVELEAAARVRQVLKGRHATAVVHIAFLRAAVPTALEDLAPGERALLFLIREGGRYRFVDPVNGKLPLAGRGPYQGRTPIARVLNALSAAVRSKSAASASFATYVLAAADCPGAVRHLRRLAARGPPAARVEAVISLLRRDPHPALPLARRLLQTHGLARAEREEVQRNIAVLVTPQLAQEIARWLGDREPAVRRAAAQALEASASRRIAGGGAE